MALKTENFFKNQVRISKISIFFATTVSFLLMSTLGLLVINYNSVQTSLKESVTFNLVLSDLLEEKETQQLIKSLSLLEQIKSVNYISKENAATNLIVELGEDFLGVLGYNPLSNMIEVQFFADFITEFNSAKQANFLLDHKEIEDVFYDKNLLFLLEKNLSKLRWVVLLIACLVISASFVLINTNIRLTIYSKRFTIKTMQLVGATKQFIQKPFLISNILISFCSCLMGSIILVGLFFLAEDKLPAFKNFLLLGQFIYLIIGISVLNILVSFLSTWICVRNYLNLTTEDLYN